jgi:UDP-N-acetylmuramoyl-L-alanyl-D-glutamate--2,6-diaminopimelate ligase
LNEGADLYIDRVHYDPAGMHFTVFGPGFTIQIDSPFIGSFNVSNILAALGATVVGLGVNPQAAARGIAELKAIPGRMENINMGQDFTAIVDFAHTPNALRRALETARELCKGRLISVFGSAGLRDQAKRRLMAEESIRAADLTILTAEDPRTESLDAILAEMAGAAAAAGGKEGRNFWRVPDRGEAIRTALSMARAEDVVICCGKGHEQSMCFGTIEYPWDDRTALRAALAEKVGIEGPEMPSLPTGKKQPGEH